MVGQPRARTPQTVAIPMAFLRDAVPAIIDRGELQVSLAFFRLAAERGSEETPLAERSILRDAPLRTALRHGGMATEIDDRIIKGLELALGRGTVLRFSTGVTGNEDWWYYLNTAVNRETVAAMQRGHIPPPQVVWDAAESPRIAVDPPNAYRLYEMNIGPLSPIVADQISRAAEEFPIAWIEDAIEQAVIYNKRSWRYIDRVLQSWQENGHPADQSSSRSSGW